MNESTLTASPSSFLVEGSLSHEFEQEILNRCKTGTKGMVNGNPAEVRHNGIKLQETLQERKSSSIPEILTKINIVGGKIIENIMCSEPVKIDTTKTEFLGKIEVSSS